MGGRGSGSTGSRGGGKLQPISVNEDWAWKPDDLVDLSDMRKNPIPFVGVGEDKRLATIFEDLTIQPKYESDVEVKISELKTLQAFVLQSGIDTPRSWDGSVRPFVIQFEGEKYLIDGNHRVAKAMLDGHKTIRVDISYQVLKN